MSAAPSAAPPAASDRSVDALLRKLQLRQAAAAAASAQAQQAAAAAAAGGEGALAAAASSPAAVATALSADVLRSTEADLQALRDGGSSSQVRAQAQAAMKRLTQRMDVQTEQEHATSADPAAPHALKPNVAARAYLQSLPSATRKTLFDTLLACFLPPPRQQTLLPDSSNAAALAGSSAGAAVAPLILRYRDTAECRRSAVAIVRTAVGALPDLEENSFLPRVITTLAVCVGTVDLAAAPLTLGANTTAHERGGKNVTPLGETDLTPQSIEQAPKDTSSAPKGSIAAAREAAEEKAHARSEQALRVDYISLLRQLLIYCGNRELGPHLPLVCSMLYVSLCGATEDAAHIDACDCLARLADDYPQYMRPYSRVLLIPLMQRLLRHYHSRVRLAAVLAMARLLPCGAAELLRDLAAFRESNVIEIAAVYHGEARTNYMGLLVADSNLRVREAFIRTVCTWALTLPERADYETLLMPYFLSGLADEAPSIRAIALTSFEQAGRAFESEEKERLASGIGGNAQDESAFRTKLQAEELSRTHLSAAQLPVLLFEPFTSRPSWGMRQLGRKFLERLYHAILSEVSDWKSGVSSKSWTLLRVLLVLAEEYITHLCPRLAQAFVDVAQRGPQGTTPAFWDCVALFGRYTHPERMADALNTHVRQSVEKSSERLVAALNVAEMALSFLAPAHPLREAALSSVFSSVFASPARSFLTHDFPVFASYVRLMRAIVSGIDLGAWISSSQQGAELFRVALELGGWSRRLIQFGGGAAPSAEGRAAQQEVQSQNVDCYRCLDADASEDLMPLFQQRLLPIIEPWIPAAAAAAPASSSSSVTALSKWNDRDRALEFGMLLEALDHSAAASTQSQGQSSLFVPVTPADADALTSAQRLSSALQALILAFLQLNPSLPLHAALLVPLAPCLAAAPSPALGAAFVRGVVDALLHGLVSRAEEHASYRSAHLASAPAPSSLLRLPHDAAKRAAAEAAAFEAREALFAAYARGVVNTVTALKDKLPMAEWTPSEAQRELLQRPLPSLPQLRALSPARGDDAAPVPLTAAALLALPQSAF